MKISVRKKMFFVVCAVFFISIFIFNYADASSNKYYIKVNKGTNVATVYKTKGNEPYRAFIVSCGQATPKGTFYTKNKYRWKALMGPSYGQYSTRITGSILFHSVWYYKNGDKASQSINAYNKLGTTASHGCVRLTVADAKWIYDNCPLGTKVVIFSGKSKDDPLGKPSFDKIKSSKRQGWDPTDPDKNNPYNKITYKGVSAGTFVKHIGTKVNIKKDVTAKTKAGKNLTSKISITIKKPGDSKHKKTTASTCELSKKGTYEVKYTVKDSKTGVTKKLTVKYVTKDLKEAKFTGISKDKKVEYNSIINIKSKVKAKNATGKDLTSKISIKVKKPGDESYKKYTSKELKFTKLGTYKVEYKVTNPNNDKVAKKVVTFKCQDTKAPIIEGVQDGYVKVGSDYDVMKGITAKAVSGKNLTSKIKVEVLDSEGNVIAIENNTFKCIELGEYTIKYSVSNDYGTKATKTMNLLVVETIIEESKPSTEDNTENNIDNNIDNNSNNVDDNIGEKNE